MKLLCVLILASLPVWAQLPDAPSTCMYKGKPCPQWLASTIGPYPVPPDEVMQIKYPHLYSDGPRFFQFRSGPYDKPATNRQVLSSKAYIVQLAFMIGSEELARTRTHSDSEPLAALGVAGFSFIGYKYISPSFTLGMTGSGAHWLKEWAEAK